MKNIFRLGGWLTLLFDAYLLLAMLASNQMKEEYLQWLPPFGNDYAAQIPSGVYIAVIVWTAFLAVGCLGGRERVESATEK